MATQYDYYRELVKTRQGMDWNNLLVAEVANSLHSIHDEIEAVRRTTTASMAIQQELLIRELIQAKLEDFIYQAEKMVDEFENANGAIELSTQYYLLTGLLETIKDQGISTVFIRGRDNKAAFDKVVNRAVVMRQRLAEEKQVKKVLLWAEEDQRRAAEKKKQEEAELEAQRQRRVAPLKKKENGLKHELEKVALEASACEAEKNDLELQIKNLRAGRTPSNFVEWYTFKFPFENVIGHGLMWLFYGFVWIPGLWLLTKGSLPPADPEVNAKINAQIEELKSRIRTIDFQISTIRQKSERLGMEFITIQEQIREAIS